MKRAILQSGSLYLSPPAPAERGNALIEALTKIVQRERAKSLRDAPAASLLKGLDEMGIKSMWLQAEPALDGWQQRAEQVEELLIGDVEYEVKLPLPTQDYC